MSMMRSDLSLPGCYCYLCCTIDVYSLCFSLTSSHFFSFATVDCGISISRSELHSLKATPDPASAGHHGCSWPSCPLRYCRLPNAAAAHHGCKQVHRFLSHLSNSMPSSEKNGHCCTRGRTPARWVDAAQQSGPHDHSTPRACPTSH